MLKKKIKIAVIDSGIDMNAPFFKGKDIVSLKIEDNEFVNCNTDTNGHGTLVSSYIIRECENLNLNIISIQILNKLNRASVDKLIQAIEYCISDKVDIINLSLGICINSEKIDMLESICNKAIENGILIFSSHNNIGKISYPSNFKNIIGVGYNQDIKNKVFKVDKDNRNIYISNPLISMNHFGVNASKPGNSFLCPYIVGLFCSYIDYYNLEIGEKDTYTKFLNFIELIEENYKDKIFNLNPENVKDKKILFYPLDKENENIIESYKHIFNDIKYYTPNNEKTCLNTYKDIEEGLKNTDIFVIGNIDYITERSSIKSLIDKVKLFKKDVLIRYSFISTFDRYLLSKETGKRVYCQHL